MLLTYLLTYLRAPLLIQQIALNKRHLYMVTLICNPGEQYCCSICSMLVILYCLVYSWMPSYFTHFIYCTPIDVFAKVQGWRTANRLESWKMGSRSTHTGVRRSWRGRQKSTRAIPPRVCSCYYVSLLTHSLRLLVIYRMGQKSCYTLVDNFGKYRPISIILSLLDS